MRIISLPELAPAFSPTATTPLTLFTADTMYLLLHIMTQPYNRYKQKYSLPSALSCTILSEASLTRFNNAVVASAGSTPRHAPCP